MKMDFLKGISKGLLAMAVAPCASGQATQRGSKEGTRSASTVQGRTVLQIEDVKTLLSDRDPSNPSSALGHRLLQEEADGILSIKLALSKMERAQLAARVAQIENQKIALRAQLEKNRHEQRSQLGAQRLGLQRQRLGAAPQSDRDLSQNLFTNLVRESNVRANYDRALSDFDQTHAFIFEFDQVDGAKWVRRISIGEEVVWYAENSPTQVARK